MTAAPPPSAGRAGRRRLGDLAPVAQLAPAAAFLGVFLFLPLGLFVAYSFWRVANFDLVRTWSLDQYREVITSEVDRSLLWTTLQIASITAVVTVAVAYVYAHMIRFHLRRYQEPLLLLVMVALFSGYLVRVYAWRTILGDTGVINGVLTRLGIIDEPLTFLLYSRVAVITVLCNFLVPLAVLPIYAALQDIGDDAIEAARDLGCGAARTLLGVTLPLARRGLFVAFALSFITTAGDYVTPQLVGGTSGTMIGRAVQNSFLAAYDFPRGAALSFVTLVIVLGILGALWQGTKAVLR